MKHYGQYDRLYIYEGCSTHGVKIGISRAKTLARRLVGIHVRCRANAQFAKVWELPNAHQIEQCVIGILQQSGRQVPPGEEWFHVSCEEMIDAVGFAFELYDPDRNRPRRYRMICGHVSKA